jgi:hypothetical protein
MCAASCGRLPMWLHRSVQCLFELGLVLMYVRTGQDSRRERTAGGAAHSNWVSSNRDDLVACDSGL